MIAQRFLWKLEGAWWATRLHILNYSLLIGAAAWLAADESQPVVGLLGMLVAVACLHGCVMTVNDLLDQEADEVTAPYLPLVAGILSRRQAWVSLGCLGAMAMGGLALAAEGDLEKIALVLALIAAVFVSTVFYSHFKWAGALGSLFATLPLLVAPLGAWIAAGGGDPVWIGAIVAYAFVRGFSLNIIAGLRDLDADPLVGNRTLPVRIGADRAFAIMVALDMAAAAIVFALALGVPGGWPALVVLTPAVAWMLLHVPGGLGAHRERDRGRLQRVRDIWVYAHGRIWCDAALVCVFGLLPGLALGIALWLLRELGEHGYRSRIVSGRLARKLGAGEPVAKAG